MGQDVQHKYFVSVVLPAIVAWLVHVVQVFESKGFLFESFQKFSEKKLYENLDLDISWQLSIEIQIFILLYGYDSILHPLVVKEGSDVPF